MNNYNKGDVVRIKGSFLDVDDNPIDPDVVRVQVKTPSGTVTEYTYGVGSFVTKESVGVYYADVNANASGVWRYRYYSTGNGQAANETRFVIEVSAFG